MLQFPNPALSYLAFQKRKSYGANQPSLPSWPKIQQKCPSIGEKSNDTNFCLSLLKFIVANPSQLNQTSNAIA
jgi:hypothetical protein